MIIEKTRNTSEVNKTKAYSLKNASHLSLGYLLTLERAIPELLHSKSQFHKNWLLNSNSLKQKSMIVINRMR